MAKRYQAALSRAGINTAGPQLYWQLRSNTANRLRVIELGITVNTAPTTAPLFQISRATATLGTASTSLTGLALDSNDATATGILESAWSSAPTINTTYHRMMGLPVTAGNGFIWTWPVDSPLIIGDSGTAHALQITNANASGATTGNFAAYVVWEE
jgi:hypothetical protein